jgi:hypothetical protein
MVLFNGHFSKINLKEKIGCMIDPIWTDVRKDKDGRKSAKKSLLN